MADDFHTSAEWYEFESRIKKAFPDKQIVDIPDDDPIFHTVYDLNERVQIPGRDHLRDGLQGEWGLLR